MPQPDLWDHLEAGLQRQQHQQAAAMEAARRKTFKKLRANGHWLTLLRVARTVPQPFTLNDVSVAAWRSCPEFFSMKGYAYPDNHKVHSILYGHRGLIAKGLIRRISEGLFRVPDEVDPDALLAAHAEGEE